MDLRRIETIRREHSAWTHRPREELSETEVEIQDLLAALDATGLVDNKLRSFKAARQTALLMDKLHFGRDRNDEAHLRHWEAKIAALICGDSEERFEDLFTELRAERDRFEALAKERLRENDTLRSARVGDLLTCAERVRKACMKEATLLRSNLDLAPEVIDHARFAATAIHDLDLAEAIFGKDASVEAKHSDEGNDLFSDATLAEVGVVVRSAPDIPGTWVAHFTDFNCVTQGTSRLDAVAMLLDSARLMLCHLSPEGVCDVAAVCAGRSEHAP